MTTLAAILNQLTPEHRHVVEELAGQMLRLQNLVNRVGAPREKPFVSKELERNPKFDRLMARSRANIGVPHNSDGGSR